MISFRRSFGALLSSTPASLGEARANWRGTASRSILRGRVRLCWIKLWGRAPYKAHWRASAFWLYARGSLERIDTSDTPVSVRLRVKEHPQRNQTMQRDGDNRTSRTSTDTIDASRVGEAPHYRVACSVAADSPSESNRYRAGLDASWGRLSRCLTYSPVLDSLSNTPCL
ncbi:hypothetical protein GGR52DRAFT_532001 [Hypoxylon sp. FL1284]|nr:hypothetical protein GGR52DRAFT_532001 [Hypoxylon sp. FL1284]